MRQESGRSLIEIVGVIAIGTIMTAAAIGMYRMMRENNARTIATSQLEQIAGDVKLLMEMRGDYSGVSVDYLIKAGALKSDKSPLGGDNWSVTASTDGESFSINLTELTQGECSYFQTTKPQWAASMLINGYEVLDNSDRCFSTPTNQISFVVQ
ncbi:MAG: hypothetical protein E7009_04175 [Alphaproteobacteria bacterium]|nr:hypothetical protein [Alphaproteobacteria bacterium]